MTGWFDVDPRALRTYADDLGRYAGQAKQFSDQVAQADVGDASWGIVGLFTKEKYDETIGNLQEFLRSAEGYAIGLDERMRAAGDTYDELDGAARASLDELSKLLGRTPASTAPAGASNGSGGTGDFADFGADGYAQQKEQANGGSKQDVSAFVADGASFVYDCYSEMQSMAANPLQWLVSMGLGFLLEVVQPLQDLLELVSGDPQALEQASGRFLEIEQGLLDMRQVFTEATRDRLAQWTGVSAQAAKKRLTDFAVGTGGAAERAGSLAELLAVSAIVMEVIYDLLKSIISELVTFLIELWLPALAAAITSFGASVAAATATTVVQTTKTVATTTKKVKTLSDLLQKLVQVLLKLAVRAVQKYFKFQGDAARMRADRQAARDGRSTAAAGGPRAYSPDEPRYDGPGGWDRGPGYTGRPGVDMPDFDRPEYDRPEWDRPGLGGGIPVGGSGSRGYSAGDFGGGGGTAAASFGPSGAGIPGGETPPAAGAQSGVAQAGGPRAAGSTGAAAGMGGGAAGGGMMGGGGAGAGRGQGGEERNRQGKGLLQEDAEELFGPDELTPPPVIGEVS